MIEYKFNGAIPSPVDPRDYRLPAGMAKASLPEEWWPEQIPVHNQGQINSCVGHAITAGYEQAGFPAMAYGYIYGNRKYTDWTGEGLIVRDALKTVQKDGVPTLASYPYDAEVKEIIDLFEAHAAGVAEEAAKYRLGNYYRLTSGAECRQAQKSGLKVFYSLYLFQEFLKITKENPVLALPNTSGQMIPLGGHLVIGNGWDKRGCRLLNSYGPDWGENGNFYILDEMFGWSDQYGFPIPLVEAWGVEIGKEPVPQKTGWYEKDGHWRYFDGKKDVVGWLQTWAWFYLDIFGNMVTGWQKIGGKWYYFNSSGVMQTGWLYDGSKDVWYYLTNSGGMAVGWRKIEGKWYYFNGSGAMATGLQSITGKQYYFFERSQGGHLRGEMLLTDGAGAIQ